MNKKILMISAGIIVSFILILGVFFLFTSNVSTYDVEERTMIIRDSLFSNDIIAEISLKSDLNVYVIRGKDRLVAEFEVDSLEKDYNTIFEKMEFYDIQDNMKEFERRFTYKYKQFYEQEVNDYEIICKEKEVWNEINKSNDIEYYDCTQNLIGSHIERKFNWVELNDKERLPEGKLIIGIFTDVEAKEVVEWIPTILGTRIPQWASWTEVLDVGLVAYWSFDGDGDGSGTNIQDVVRSKHNATTTNNPTWVTGKIGTGMNFSKSSQQSANIGDHADFAMTANDVLTVSLWSQWVDTSDSTQQLFGRGYDGAKAAYQLGGVSAEGGAATYDGGWSSIQYTNYDESKFNHVVARWNLTHISLWINGSQVNQVAHATGIPATTSNLIFGAIEVTGAAQNWANVKIDEIGIWNRSLTENEIIQLYNNGDGIPYDEDIIPPSVIINSPANTSYNIPINFTVTATDGTQVDDCWVTINSGTTNFSMFNTSSNPSAYNYSAPSLYSDGGYLAEFYCNDTEGNINNTETISFLIDTINPEINITYPINLSSFTYNTVDVNYTYSDTNIDSCWYSNGTYEFNTTLTSCGTNITDVLWVDGEHNVTIWINDSAGNENSSRVTFTIDASPPVITIVSPANNTNTTNINLDINYTAVDVIGIGSCWYSNDTYIKNTTLTNCGTNITDVIWSEGQHNITIWANDSAGWESQSSIIFSIDLTSPEVNITSPLNETEYVTFTGTYNVSFNFSGSDLHISNCWYYNGTANTSIACGSNASINLTAGWTEVIYYVNDSAGNVGSHPVSILVNYITQSAIYTDPVLEGETHTIILNITANDITSFNGTLNYNGTLYNTTATFSSTYGELSTTLVAPDITADTLYNFNWTYWINGVNRNTTDYNHTIQLVNVSAGSVCDTGLNASLCWNFKIETNLTTINASIDYNFKFGGTTNDSSQVLYGSLDNVAQFCICINETIYNNYSLGYGEIQYSKSGYTSRRFYLFNTTRLTSTLINNTLYLLENAQATSFLFDFKNTILTPYVGKYATLLRWYPELNEYIIVEMAKTDDKGETIMRVKVEDVDYRVGFYHQSGTLIQLLNPVRFACLSAPCSYSTIIQAVAKDYTSFFDVQTSITYNTTSSLWTFIWNDPTQNTESMSFEVIRERGDGHYTICDNSASGYTGLLTCDSSGYTGTIRGMAYRTASPQVPIASKVINTANTPFKGVVGLFISFIIVTLLMLIGIFSPIASIILGIVALVPAFYFGSITLEIFIGIAVLGGIIIHFMKRTG